MYVFDYRPRLAGARADRGWAGPIVRVAIR